MLVSRSSAVEEEASHFEISPALTEAQETGSSPKRRFCTVGRETPDPMVASLHPTPSPYQDSNCEEQPSVEVQKVSCPSTLRQDLVSAYESPSYMLSYMLMFQLVDSARHANLDHEACNYWHQPCNILAAGKVQEGFVHDLA